MAGTSSAKTRFALLPGHDECSVDCRPAYFSPTLNGGSLSGGTVSSAIASIIATMT
jgi:hypothetical protein